MRLACGLQRKAQKSLPLISNPTRWSKPLSGSKPWRARSNLPCVMSPTEKRLRSWWPPVWTVRFGTVGILVNNSNTPIRCSPNCLRPFGTPPTIRDTRKALSCPAHRRRWGNSSCRTSDTDTGNGFPRSNFGWSKAFRKSWKRRLFQAILRLQ